MPLPLARAGSLGALLLTVLLAFAAPRGETAAAQMGSGATVLRFLDALDRGDLDTVMTTWSNDPEVETADGARYVGVAAVRGYFESFPRPIIVMGWLPWGGRRFEAQITANGTPLLLTFLGADGVIAAMYVEPDPTSGGSASLPRDAATSPDQVQRGPCQHE